MAVKSLPLVRCRRSHEGKNSITGQYLSGRKFIALPDERRKPGKNCIEIRGAKENNLQNVNVKFPIGLFNVVTGVSGSGKST